MFDFTGSVNEFRRNLSEQHALGGGDYPEAIHLALEQSGKLSWQDKDVARVLFLVADAPPHRRFSQRTVNAVLDLRSLGVTIFPVAASGVRDEAEFVMRAASFLTMGQYLFLTDHSGVGNPHTKPHTPRYQIEKLNQLMIRMIASELAGRWIPQHEIIAAEEINRTPPVETSIERHQLPESTFTPAQAQVGKSVCGYFGILQCLDRFTGIISWLALPALIVFLVVAERRWAA
ncbi:MAG: hypothetical protein IH899_10590 [Planctomycetes bacterium]|nr:hypothetical protein [Planctomycetota bacterium]